MNKLLLALSPSWQSPEFRRILRDKKGRVVSTLLFQKRTPVEIKKNDEFLAVRDSIGAALVVARSFENEQNETKFRNDPDATVDAVVQIAIEKIRQKELLLTHQRRHYEHWVAAKEAAAARQARIDEAAADLKCVCEQLDEDPDNEQLLDRKDVCERLLSELKGEAIDRPDSTDSATGESTASPESNHQGDSEPDPRVGETVIPPDESGDAEPLEKQIEDAETELELVQEQLATDPDNADLRAHEIVLEGTIESLMAELEEIEALSSDDLIDEFEVTDEEPSIEDQVGNAELDLANIKSQLESDPENADLKKQVSSAKRRVTNLKKKLNPV